MVWALCMVDGPQPLNVTVSSQLSNVNCGFTILWREALIGLERFTPSWVPFAFSSGSHCLDPDLTINHHHCAVLCSSSKLWVPFAFFSSDFGFDTIWCSWP